MTTWTPLTWQRIAAGIAQLGIAGFVSLALCVPAHAAHRAEHPSGQAPSNADHAAGSAIARHEHAHPHGGRQAAPAGSTPGLDVSGHQGNVDWPSVATKGAKFAYVKATEGTNYQNPFFGQQYNGAYGAGLVRGAYHFALPDRSGGIEQANFFVDHGGGWSRDGRTLPPALDIEYNPYGPSCYGLTQPAMVGWIKSFSDRVLARTGRWPTIYTSSNWWSNCIGTQGDFSKTNPLWIAAHSAQVGALPHQWGFHTIWQYATSGTFPGDQDYFNGDAARLRAFATG